MRPGLIQIVLAIVISYLIIGSFFSNDKDFGNLALGTETSIYHATDDTNYIHLVRLLEPLEENLTEGWKHRGSKDVFLLLGNSQMHSINQLKEGQTTYVGLLHDQYRDSIDFIGYSCPNASLQDFYLTFNYWSSKLNVKYAAVPLFMDDMREESVRTEFFPYITKQEYQITDTQYNIAKKINRELRRAWTEQSSGNANNAVQVAAEEVEVEQEKTFQDITEAYLNNKLDSISQVWHNRPNVRGELFNGLYKLRNTVLGISASTVREMIPQRYEKNMEAYRALLETAKEKGIKLLVYIPPIRSDAPLPYNLSDYEKYKKQMEEMANEYANVYFANYEDAVPGPLWGYKDATSFLVEKEVDYMHFQYKGHQILSEKLSSSIAPLIK